MSDGNRQPTAPLTGGPSERIGLIGWLGLYVSGGLLFFFLLIHILAIHFIGGGDVTAASVRTDADSSFLTVIGIGLLLVGLFHGLLGLRRMVLDLEIFGKQGDRWFKWILYLAGAALVIYGVIVYTGLSSM